LKWLMVAVLFGLITLSGTLGYSTLDYSTLGYANTLLPTVTMPPSSLQANHLAVVINDRDSLSVKIARYYQHKRQIPERNMIRVSFDPGKPEMHPREFAVLMKGVERNTPAAVQAFVLTWAEPYRVGCMSISSAFAFGFDHTHCATGCKPTQLSHYAGSASNRPYQHYGIRPTMLLAATSYKDAKALIDRGVAADSSFPKGSAYLVTTTDSTRSVRNVIFPEVENQLADYLPIHNNRSDGIFDKHDIMFYFTGDKFVADLDSNTYLPGAMADHLTSAGGKLTDSAQMSAIRWLEAGLTGSYGTVVEPCNILAKFPNPLAAMRQYLRGNTLIEAYWKSVQMPGQGVFIGEPLARPYGGYQLKEVKGALQLSSPQFTQGYYAISTSSTLEGPYLPLFSGIEITAFKRSIRLPKPYKPFYKVERLEQYGRPPVGHLLPH
jgi:uncharacterized protein (TIGR03790 family)